MTKDIQKEYVEALNEEVDEQKLLAIKNKYLNHEYIQQLYRSMRTCADTKQKGQITQQIKEFKACIEELCSQRVATLKTKESLVDTSLPVVNKMGSIHPMTVTINHIRTIMHSMSFEGMKFCFRESPEIDTSFNNFDALNIPALHPCRTDHQSFHIDDNYILRTHTTSTTAHILQENTNESGAYFSMGRNYRRDSDATHTPMFHQWEVLVVHSKANFPSLLTFVKTFLNTFFGRQLKYRFRPSFFPFTRFSTEVDIWFNNRWLELLGCGIIAPEVFESCNSQYRMAFAMGGGIERLCMVRNNIKDIRSMYGNRTMTGFCRFGDQV